MYTCLHVMVQPTKIVAFFGHVNRSEVVKSLSVYIEIEER